MLKFLVYIYPLKFSSISINLARNTKIILLFTEKFWILDKYLDFLDSFLDK